MTDEQIIEELATKVMGWTAGKCGSWNCWLSEKVGVRRPYEGWNPLTNAADREMVEDELLSQGYDMDIQANATRINKPYFRYRIGDQLYEYIAEAETRGRAVAQCALRSVGVEV